MKNLLNRILAAVMSLRLTVVTLILLMVVVFWGTLYQKTHGLHAAQEAFYYAWLTPAIGFIPLPGGLTLLWILFINLLLSMMVQFHYGWRKFGVVLVHFGILLMLAGGWVTLMSGQQGFLTLQEGERSNLASDYNAWEISAWREPGAERTVTAWDARHLATGRDLDFGDLGFSLGVREYYANASAYTRDAAEEEQGDTWLNAAGIRQFEAQALEREPERNLPGAVFDVKTGAGDTAVLALYAGEASPTVLNIGDEEVFVQLRRRRYPLPAAIRLEDFQRSYHPNSKIPRSFSSRITASMHDMEREVVVEMNRPFRYMGTTFYQASFSAPVDGREISTFAVTYNRGRLVPYVATAVTVLGLAVHFLIAMKRRPGTLPGAAS